MSLDPTRAAFVQNEYRNKIAEDLSVLTNYTNAQELVIETNLTSASDANTLAVAMLAALKVPAAAFEVDITATISIDDFVGGAPRYTTTFPEYNISGKTTKIISVDTDWMAGRNTIVVRS